MKRLLVCALLCSSAFGAAVTDVQSVYLLPMPGGLDQYLANRLSGMFKVVTDPKLADAVFTNQLGEAFEQQLAKLYPAAGTEQQDPDKDGRRETKQSSFGRGKGTIFLVDLKSRTVIWSAYQKSNGTTPESLDRTASQIVQQIKKAK